MRKGRKGGEWINAVGAIWHERRAEVGQRILREDFFLAPILSYLGPCAFRSEFWVRENNLSHIRMTFESRKVKGGLSVLGREG